MGSLTRIVSIIVKWLEDNNIFERERKCNEQRALGMLLCHAGLSYDKTGIFVDASHEAVREWYQKGKVLFEMEVEKKRRYRIAIDEKELTINGTTVFIWGAVDLDDEKAIAVGISYGRSCLEAMGFLQKVRRSCSGRLPRVFIDGGTWYPWALQRTGFSRYSITHFGPRSAIERLFGDIECRIRRFWNGYSGGYTKDGLSRWISSFIGFRNFWKDFYNDVLS